MEIDEFWNKKVMFMGIRRSFWIRTILIAQNLEASVKYFVEQKAGW
jgi:hypothetical protein